MKTNTLILPEVNHLQNTSFYLSVSNRMPELVSSDGTMRIPMASLDSNGLIRAKNFAHNQYINAMMQDSDELDVHRATLNFLFKTIERTGNPTVRPHTGKPIPAPSRKMAPKFERKTKQTQAA